MVAAYPLVTELSFFNLLKAGIVSIGLIEKWRKVRQKAENKHKKAPKTEKTAFF
jgi:hypothetical protein